VYHGVGVGAGIFASGKSGSVSCDYIISQQQVVSATSWLHAVIGMLPSSSGWLDGM